MARVAHGIAQARLYNEHGNNENICNARKQSENREKPRDNIK